MAIRTEVPSPVSEAELPASVLLVDDDHEILEYYSDVLKPKGYQVQTASDVPNADAMLPADTGACAAKLAPLTIP